MQHSGSRKRAADEITPHRVLEDHVAALTTSLAAVQKLLAENAFSPAVHTPAPAAAEQQPCELDLLTPDSCDSLAALRGRLRSFAVEREWDQFHTPRNIMLALVGEVGELAECFQWRGDAGSACPGTDWEAKKVDALGEEMADVLLYLVRLADKCGVDLAAVTSRKLQKNAHKYPADLVRGSSKKYTEYAAHETDSSGGGTQSNVSSR